MSDLSFERIKEMADKYGIRVEKADDSREGGFHLKQKDGSTKKLSVDEMMEYILPGSMELLRKPSRIEELKSKMNKLVSNYREAVADDDSYSQGEADEELSNLLDQHLLKESFSLVDLYHVPYGGTGGKGDHATLQSLWMMVKNDLFSEQKWIVWDEVSIPCPSDEQDYDRFGDFVRYIARSYGISYQL